MKNIDLTYLLGLKLLWAEKSWKWDEVEINMHTYKDMISLWDDRVDLITIFFAFSAEFMLNGPVLAYSADIITE